MFEITDKQIFIGAIILFIAAVAIRITWRFYQPAFLKTVQEWVEVLLTAIVLALIMRAFVIQAFKIPSGSMEDTYLIGDHLLVNRFVFGIRNPFNNKTLIRIRSPRSGEVVVFKYPQDPNRDFIKRCIGVPGDIISMKGQQVFRNGQPLVEPYAVHKSQFKDYNRDNFKSITIPADCFFVMGDNRDDSYDSRFWGFVPYDNLKGTPLLIYWPLDRVRLAH